MADEEAKSSTAKRLGTAGLVVTILTGAVGLLFVLQPDLKPCIGAHEATFTGAPVFPRADYKAFLGRKRNPAVSAHDINDAPELVGAEIRLSYSAVGLRGDDLTFRSSLVSIKPDHTLGAVDPRHDRKRGPTVRPDTCDEVVGRDIFVRIRRPGRYRVVLELYRNGSQGEERLALTQTAIFSG